MVGLSNNKIDILIFILGFRVSRNLFHKNYTLCHIRKEDIQMHGSRTIYFRGMCGVLDECIKCNVCGAKL